MPDMEEMEGQVEVQDRQDLSIRDVLDSQLLTSDGYRIARVADIVGEWRADGSFVLTHLVTGPEALAGRIAWGLRAPLERLLHGRFDCTFPLSDIQRFGPTLRLPGRAGEYKAGQSERWIADHILRWIPGSGHEK